jgi:hypothetical protein
MAFESVSTSPRAPRVFLAGTRESDGAKYLAASVASLSDVDAALFEQPTTDFSWKDHRAAGLSGSIAKRTSCVNARTHFNASALLPFSI